MSYIGALSLVWCSQVWCPYGPDTPGTKMIRSRASDRPADHASGRETIRERFAPCCWAPDPCGAIFDPDVSRGRQRRITAARWPLSGPAAAIDKYEDDPHGEDTVRRPPRTGQSI